MIVRRFGNGDVDHPTNGIAIKYEDREFVLYEIGCGTKATGEESYLEWCFLAPIDWRTSYALQEVWEEIKEELFDKMGLEKGHSVEIAPGAIYIDHQELDLIDGMLFVRTYKAINM